MNCKDLFKPVENVLRMRRVNPAFQLLLLVLALAVVGVLAVLFGIAEGIKLALIDEKVRKELPKARAQKKSNIDNSKIIYYVVKDVKMSKYCLTQYAEFFIVHNNEMKNITNYLCSQYYFLNKYSGKSDRLKGTIKLVDYDIIRLQEELGKELVETIV